jgi:hypothetical protein
LSQDLDTVLTNLSETVSSLAAAAPVLAGNAVPAAVPVKMPGGAVAPPGIEAAIAAGAPLSVPPAGLLRAQPLSRAAAPVAASAPLAAPAVPVFAPLANAQ